MEVGISPILQVRKLRLREVKKIVQDPKLLIGRAEIPIWICLVPKSMPTVTHTHTTDSDKFPVGDTGNLGSSLDSKATTF